MLELIKKYEGCHLSSYKCPKGIWTIGWGNIMIDGRYVKEGDKITQDRADQMLNDYVELEIVPVLKDLNLKGRQLSAFVSLCFNLGTPKIMGDKDLISAIKEKRWVDVHKNWTWGYKNNLKGLRIRRAEELFWFMQDT